MIEELKTKEQMHTMTIDELRSYCTFISGHWSAIRTIRDYRIETNDEYNPLLLTGITEVEERSKTIDEVKAMDDEKKRRAALHEARMKGDEEE